MKNYDHYTLEDFVQDFYFRQWALGLSDPRDDFWEKWAKSNPEKQLLLEEASSMVIGLAFEPGEPEAFEIEQAISGIRRKIHHRPFFRRRWFSYAAAIFLPVFAIMATWYFFDDAAFAGQTGSRSESDTGNIRWQVNDGVEAVNIGLPDGSSITLGPQSKLGYSLQFGEAERLVWLEGEAVFDVARNPDKPFIVHAHNVLTKVLGTVFQVSAHEKDENVSVSVTSGKVTVQKKAADTGSENTAAELILTPNQQAVISRNDDKMIKTLIKNPGVLREPELHRHFVFSDTPISEVFTTLEQAYGIPIAYDAEKLEKCNLTARLSEEDLFDKLDLICETIQASYRITDGQILVNSVGCD